MTVDKNKKMRRLIIVFGVIVAVLSMLIAYSTKAQDQQNTNSVRPNAGIINKKNQGGIFYTIEGARG